MFYLQFCYICILPIIQMSLIQSAPMLQNEQCMHGLGYLVRLMGKPSILLLQAEDRIRYSGGWCSISWGGGRQT